MRLASFSSGSSALDAIGGEAAALTGLQPRFAANPPNKTSATAIGSYAQSIFPTVRTSSPTFEAVGIARDRAQLSSFTYKGKPVDVKQVGRDLGVRYMLEGSVRKVGNRVRVTDQLIDAESGAHIWADRFDRDLHRHLRSSGTNSRS